MTFFIDGYGNVTLNQYQKLQQLAEKVQSMGLNPADVIRVKEKTLNPIKAILVHYVVLYRWEGAFPIFAANYPGGGVRELPLEDLLRFAEIMSLHSVRKFSGSEEKRKQALTRIEMCFGAAPYDWKDYNCETFANYVQHGEMYSLQSNIATGAVAALGLGTLVFIVAKGGKKVASAIVILVLIIIALLYFQQKRTDGVVAYQ